jgi:heat-inducible transcriptional repressor
MGKQEIILEAIIREYIKIPEPIGSEQLRVKMDIKISSATIRSYFKKLVDDGSLKQLHISSGRIPTICSLRDYWKHRLLPLNEIKIHSINHINNIANRFGIFSFIKFKSNNKFKKIITVDKEYIIVIFENGEVILNYSNAIEKFLNQFYFLDINDLHSIALEVGVYELVEKIENFFYNQKHIKAGISYLIAMAQDMEMSECEFLDFLNGNIVEKLDDGISYNLLSENYMAVKQDINLNGKQAKILSVGNITRDFGNYFNILERRSYE